MSQGERQVSAPTVRPLTPVIGAEISDVDLSQPLDEATFVAIREALEAHQVIFFRDQDISVERHKELGKRFGDFSVMETNYPIPVVGNGVVNIRCGRRQPYRPPRLAA